LTRARGAAKVSLPVCDFVEQPPVRRGMIRHRVLGAPPLRPSLSPASVTLTTLAILVALAGCAPRDSTLRIVDHRSSGGAEVYAETFADGVYERLPDGNVTIVLHRREVQHGQAPLEQTVVVRSVWRPILGTTVAERTQVNATISYFLVQGDIGASFEGGGSVFFDEDVRKGTLTGTIEHASLEPIRRLGRGGALLTNAELSGRFRARRDPRFVVRLLNDAERAFGPLPPYQPPSQDRPTVPPG
jgi:hypothetical protein